MTPQAQKICGLEGLVEVELLIWLGSRRGGTGRRFFGGRRTSQKKVRASNSQRDTIAWPRLHNEKSPKMAPETKTKKRKSTYISNSVTIPLIDPPQVAAPLPHPAPRSSRKPKSPSPKSSPPRLSPARSPRRTFLSKKTKLPPPGPSHPASAHPISSTEPTRERNLPRNLPARNRRRPRRTMTSPLLLSRL